MTTYILKDSTTMLRRNLLRMIRYPIVVTSVIAVPVILFLLFVYVFGDTMGAGIGGIGAGRADYVNYVTPGIVLMAVAVATQGTAISVAMDMNEGIIARFKTMAISRASVLNGHVFGNTIQTMAGVVLTFGVALLVGFRTTAGVVEWLAVGGLLLAVTLALTWLSVAFGLVAKTVEGASSLPMPLVLLPFLGSGFVPTEGMPVGLRWFAEYQPFTPIMETLRGLLFGELVASDAVIAVAWCVGLGLVGYLWSLKLYNRDPSSSD